MPASLRCGADPDARLVDPGFPRKPGVIGAAKRATGAREKHRARPKLSRSVLMPVGIACPVCGHLTMTIPMSPSLEIGFDGSCRKVPAGWSAPLVGAGVLGGHRAPCLIEHRAVGAACSLLGLFQPAGSLLKRTLDVIERSFPSRLGEEPCVEALILDVWTSDRHSVAVQRDFHFAFTHGHITLLKRKHSPRRSPASRELALRVRSDFWMSLDPAPTRLTLRQEKPELSVRFATLAQNFF